jgi:hypothetical protein
VLPFVQLVSLSGREVMAALETADARGVRGGAVYDLLLLAAARKAGAARLLMLDRRDFHALAQPGDPRIDSPRRGTARRRDWRAGLEPDPDRQLPERSGPAAPDQRQPARQRAARGLQGYGRIATSLAKDPTIRASFDTYRFPDDKEHVIELLARVVRVIVETLRVVQTLKAAPR